MKRITITILALVAVTLMSSNLLVTSHPTLDSMKEGFIADWERAKSYSLEYLEAMPADLYDYQPNEMVRTFGQQFLHVSQGNMGLVGNATGAQKIYTNVQLFDTHEAFQGKENVIKITSEIYDWVIASIKNMDMATAQEMVGPNAKFQFSRVEWLKKAFEHQTHHRGQTAVYMRINGITPPQARLFQ